MHKFPKGHAPKKKSRSHEMAFKQGKYRHIENIEIIYAKPQQPQSDPTSPPAEPTPTSEPTPETPSLDLANENSPVPSAEAI